MNEDTPRSDKDGFQPLPGPLTAPLFRERPAADGAYIAWEDADGFVCYVNATIIEQMADWALHKGGCEVIGRLGGRHCMDAKGPYVLAEHAFLNRGAASSAAGVVADITAQDEGRRDFERACRALDSVGWWHTHPPGCGAFFSSTDRRTQSTWSNPNAIGIVLDPSFRDQAIKVFRGPKSRELRITKMFNISRTSSHRDKVGPSILGEGRNMEATPLSFQKHRPGSSAGVASAICIAGAALLFAVLTHVFVLMHMTQGDPASADTARLVKPFNIGG